MKERVVSGAILSVAAIALAISAAPAQAKHKAHRSPKATAEKHACGGKNGCPTKSDAKADSPAADKPAEAKATEPKATEAK
jgi:hypothetical protein